MSYRYYLMILLFLCTQMIAQINLRSTISKKNILIGEPLELNLYIDYPADNVLDLPNQQDAFAPFEILDFKQQTEKKEDQTALTKHLQYKIAIYDTGEFAIPPAMIIASTYVRNEPVSDTLFTRSYVIFCSLSRPDTMKTIHPPADFAADDYTLYILILLLILLIAAYLLWRWYVKRKAASLLTDGSGEIVEPPEVIAMRRLKRLKKSSWLKEQKFKLWYTELNMILREYIENRHIRIKALELPSSELLPVLEQLMQLNDLQNVRQFFQTSDLVKFARFDPAHLSHQEYLQWVEAWINEDTLRVKKAEEERDVE